MKYKKSMLRRGILAGAMVLAGCGATVAVAAAPAGASNTEMTGVGSFTTYFMMHALFPEINLINPLPEANTSETQSIAPDSSTCVGGVTYTTTNAPPNGSGKGKTALAAEESSASFTAGTEGCIDFSRSSSPPAPATETLGVSGKTESGDPSPSNLDYYAYALDGVAPLVGNDAPSTIRVAGADTGATKGLTLAQLQSIYECRTTNWDQVTVDGVAGGNSPIALFYPQSGSGTRAVMTDVLGFDPTVTTTSNTLCTTATAPIASFASTVGGSAVPNEENTEDGIIYQNTLGIAATGTPSTAAGVAIPAGSVAAAAIYVYSAGKFSSEWNDPADYNSTNTNIVEQAVTGSSSPNTVGNFLAGSLSMASMRSTGGSGLAYVDLTSQLGRFNQDTNRGEEGIDGSTVSEANEWYHNLPVRR